MPQIEIKPLSQADLSLMAGVMDCEEQAWLRQLDWDYAPIRKILFSFLEARILPGFLAMCGSQPLGYTYFLISRGKGILGTVFTQSRLAQETADLLLSHAVESLKSTHNLRRIEAQIFPLTEINLSAILVRHGFQAHRRHYLELDLTKRAWEKPRDAGRIVPWQPKYLPPAANVAYRSYRNEIDAEICEDYGTERNCEEYLRSLAENPGCGIFLPDSSLVSLDRNGAPRGFILTSRLSPGAAMIPQISILPTQQGRGLGTALVQNAICRLQSAEYRAVRLTVTSQNRRAYEWYQRIGFTVRRDFDAFVWRQTP